MTAPLTPSPGPAIGTLMEAMQHSPFLEKRLTAAAELIETLTLDNQRLTEANGRLESDLAASIKSGTAKAREITRLTETNIALNEALTEQNDRLAAASRDIEHLLHAASLDLERVTDRFNATRRVRDLMDPHVTILPQPLRAVGASR